MASPSNSCNNLLVGHFLEFLSWEEGRPKKDISNSPAFAGVSSWEWGRPKKNKINIYIYIYLFYSFFFFFFSVDPPPGLSQRLLICYTLGKGSQGLLLNPALLLFVESFYSRTL